MTRREEDLAPLVVREVNGFARTTEGDNSDCSSVQEHVGCEQDSDFGVVGAHEGLVHLPPALATHFTCCLKCLEVEGLVFVEECVQRRIHAGRNCLLYVAHGLRIKQYVIGASRRIGSADGLAWRVGDESSELAMPFGVVCIVSSSAAGENHGQSRASPSAGGEAPGERAGSNPRADYVTCRYRCSSPSPDNV